MKTTPVKLMMIVPVLAATALASAAEPLELEFNDRVDTWRTVVDGVMGGRSSGRVALSEPGILQFTGSISLENNGGFSQMRSNVASESLAEARGIELRVRGDGRTYKFDIRCSNVRMMAGAFQQDFQTTPGEWITIALPFDDFRLYSFGRRVTNAPALEPAKISSIGVTLADKNEGPFRLEIDSIRAIGETGRVADVKGDDLKSVATRAGLDTLLRLLAASELELPTDQEFTVFAPNNEAFDALSETSVRRLLQPEYRETLRSILAYHVAIPAMTSSDLLSRRSIETLNGQRLRIDSSGSISIGKAGVVAVDVPFRGGVVHVIDAALMPQLGSIRKLAAETDQLNTLAAAISVAGLGDQLSAANGPWTVFAPVDSAFASLPPGTLESLLEPENRPRLIDILGLHVIPGRLYANELLAQQRAQTLFGESIDFGITDGRLRVGRASLVATDIDASNGVVHLIDSVLLPTESTTNPESRYAAGARLCELAIARGAPLFNAGQPEACATIYQVAIEAMVMLGADGLDRPVVQRLELALADAETEHTWSDRAWVYRRALDDAYLRFTR